MGDGLAEPEQVKQSKVHDKCTVDTCMAYKRHIYYKPGRADFKASFKWECSKSCFKIKACREQFIFYKEHAVISILSFLVFLPQ